ncbi:MAG: 2-C-methyl-D-erythritol 4-phosphate cytidylyltransferase [Clostridia bacterium]|nr:2-C-methyl-D-erythritol 4-phosphate cytidylyltransferase [Clostridia bacterium]
MFFRKKTPPKPRYAAVIVAAGSGSRMGAQIPKQFLNVMNKPVLAYTIEKFQGNKYIDEIVIVTKEEYISFCKNLVMSCGFSKVSAVVTGGDTRQQSVMRGISQLSDDTDSVFIHDGARPMITDEVITKCAHAIKENNACAVGVPMKDTIKYSDNGSFIDKTVDRSHLWQIQTPQCFKKELIVRCHRMAAEEGFEATDDCMLLEHYGERVALVEGDYENIKITSPQDIYVMEGLLSDKL